MSRKARLRIALTHTYAWPDVRRGGERYMHELAAALADAGHRVVILSTAVAPRRDRVLGVEVRYLLRRNRYKVVKWFPHLGDEIAFAVQALGRLAFRRLDVWHALGTTDAAVAAFMGKFRRTRSVYTDFGIPERHYRERRSDWQLHEFVVRRIDRYICLSQTAGAQLLKDYGRDPIVLGGGVDLRAFHPAQDRNPTPALLFTSDVSESRKNLPLLLEAVALLRRRHPGLELWLAGPGDATPVLEDAPRAAKEAVVQLGVGTLEGLVDLYGRAWVTVLPSQHEAFGLVVLESLACGTPVVTLSHGAPAELVSPTVGVTSAPTPNALADACQRALELARNPETVVACRLASEPHDWRHGIVPQIEAIYRGDMQDLES